MAGTFPPDYFSTDYFGPDYFGGETNANAMSAALAGTSSVTGTLSNGAAANAPTFSPITFSSITFSTRDEEAAAGAIKPRGGDDAPRSHVGILPKLVKDKKRRKQIKRDELEALYDSIQGIEPQTKAAKQAIAAVQKAVAPQAEELPPSLDWAAIENDLKAAVAIRKAYEIIQDEEDAVIAFLLAA